MGNDILLLQSVKIWLSKNLSMNDMRETTYILGINIYRDRSKRLLSLFQSMYIYKMLKQFNMEELKRKYLLVSREIHSFKDMYPKTHIKTNIIEKIPCASAI